MPLSFQDSRWRWLTGALIAAAILLAPGPARTASPAVEKIVSDSEGFKVDGSGGLTLNKPVVRQGSTLLRAATATATGLDDESVKNSTWKFSGDVHLEFDGAVLDAEAATVVFMKGQLSSVIVQAAAAPRPGKPVRVVFDGATLDVDSAAVAFVDGRISTIQALGSPAQFSHQLKKDGSRAQGRANKLAYDARKSEINLSGDTSFSKGSKDVKTQEVTYNLADGSYYGPGSTTVTVDRDERVPAPRTPDRATAK